MFRALFISTALLLTPLAAWAAAPTIDGTPTSGIIANTNTGNAQAFTSTLTNDAIIELIGNESTTAQGLRTVSSVTQAGLAFTKLVSTTCNVQGTNTIWASLEVWSAPASSVQTGITPTILMSGTADGIAVTTLAVHGLNSISAPLDPNALAKACATAVAGPGTAPNLTTSNPNDLLIGAGFHPWLTAAQNFTTGAWTSISQFNSGTGTVAANVTIGSYDKSVTTTQSALASDIATSESASAVVYLSFAVTADASGGGFSPLMGSRSSLTGAGQ